MTKPDPAAEQPTAPSLAAAPEMPLEERPLTYSEQVARKGELVADDLVLALRDGRGVVRANAALGLAALGHTGRDLVPFLRDSHPHAARAAAEAIAHLGATQRTHLVAIVAALDGARPEVADIIVTWLSTLVGHADAELVGVLDTTDGVAANAIVDACARVGMRGLDLLRAATRDDRARVRFNAVVGVGRLADLELPSSIDVMRRLAFDDTVSEVRAHASAVIAAFIARTKADAAAQYKAGEPVPPAVPALWMRALTPDELRGAAAVAPLDELLRALIDLRMDVRLNAVRVLALQGAAAAACAPSLAVATRDADPIIRAESVRALGSLGVAGVGTAPALVRALGDSDPAVSAAAEAALAAQGAAAAPALVDGLDVPSEPHGARVAALIGRLEDGPSRLREALASTSVDVRIHAAFGLGGLGKARAGAALPALSAATGGGNARVRAAMARAVAMLDPRPDRSLPAIAIDGFEQRVLAEQELAKGKDALVAAGVAGLTPRLADARAVVRANTALALGVLGGDPPGVVDALAICLRDDAAEVRLGAARALELHGEAAVAACAHDLVRAMGGADAPLAAQLVTMLRAHAHPAIAAALVIGLDTEDSRQAQQICELVCARPDGIDLLCEAFARPGAQANVARGFVMLGKDRLGKGRSLLERACAVGTARARALARATLYAIDGAPTGPTVPAVSGFETVLLDRSSFAGAGSLDAEALLIFVTDSRAVVRANAATAIGTLGPTVGGCAITIGALLRDDDDRVRIAAAGALDQLGDEAVVAAAPYLVSALRGDARVADVCRAVLSARKAQVEAALIAGLETSDEVHGIRIAELICALPHGRELLFAAFDGEAQNAQINAAFGIAKLGATRAGLEGRRRLLSGLPGPLTRRRDAIVKALAMLAAEVPAR